MVEDKTGLLTGEMSVSELADFVEGIHAKIDLREKHCKSMKPCPACGEIQVQIINYWHIKHSDWKCRACKHKWRQELADN